MNRELPAIGTRVHIRTFTPMGWAIRRTQDRFLKRLCRKLAVPVAHSWGTHDGVIVSCGESRFGIGVCEAEPIGGVIVTPWETYKERFWSGTVDIRFYQPVMWGGPSDMLTFSESVKRYVGTRYDMRGIVHLFFKGLFFGWNERVDHSEAELWCTELLCRAEHDCAMPCLQEAHGLPMTVEQVADELPHKPRKRTTLKRVEYMI